jgi:poly(A) polymerase
MNILQINTITPNKLRNGDFQADLPEFYELRNFTENNSSHDNQNVFDHSVLVYEKLLEYLEGKFLSKNCQSNLNLLLNVKVEEHTLKDILKIATLLHDIAKSKTNFISNDGNISSPGHEILGSFLCRQILNPFCLNSAEIEIISQIIALHGFTHHIISHILRTNDMKYYHSNLKKISNNLIVPLLLLEYSDLNGSDLSKKNPVYLVSALETITEILVMELEKYPNNP